MQLGFSGDTAQVFHFALEVKIRYTPTHMSESYDWHPAANHPSVFKTESKGLLSWVLLAIAVSILIHITLWFLLGNLEQNASSSGRAEGEVIFRTSREQISIDRKLLDDLLADTTPANPEVLEQPKDNAQNLLDESLDEFDLLEKSSSETIRMSPVETPELYQSSQQPAAADIAQQTAPQLETLNVNSVLASDLNEMRQNLIDSSAQVSASQVTLQLNAGTAMSADVNLDNFLQNAAAAAGSQAQQVMKGYASLDSLISQTGGLPKGEEKIALPSDILFEYNEYAIKEQARLSMMKLAFLVQTNPDAQFIIEGHTDSIGGADSNALLSMQRASAVRDWLTENLQIDTANIVVRGLGEQRPIVSVDGTPEEQALNRRVEIIVKNG